MVQDTIQAVKEAEEKASQVLKEASAKGKAVIDEAKKQAEDVKEETLKSIKTKMAQADGDLAKQGETYLTQSMKEAEEEIIALKKSAEQKADAVVDKIISELI
ncbi:MAG: hypothetical protein RR225_07130 [Clostridium sp.]